MTVAGNGMHETVECYVCGRDGFLRIDDKGRRVQHPYTPPCDLPPRPAVVPVDAYRKTVVHVRDYIAQIQARAR